MSEAPSSPPPPTSWTFGLPLVLLLAGVFCIIAGMIDRDDPQYFISGTVCFSGGVVALLLARISYRLDVAEWRRMQSKD